MILNVIVSLSGIINREDRRGITNFFQKFEGQEIDGFPEKLRKGVVERSVIISSRPRFINLEEEYDYKYNSPCLIFASGAVTCALMAYDFNT